MKKILRIYSFIENLMQKTNDNFKGNMVAKLKQKQTFWKNFYSYIVYSYLLVTWYI